MDLSSRRSQLRRTKIVATIGPASSEPAVLEKMMLAGMDVARLNFSHGSHEMHAELVRRIREVAGRLRKSVAILQDLQGPKIRIGHIEGGKTIPLRVGQRFTITTREVPGDEKIVSTTYEPLPREIHPGAIILVDDGNIELRVREAHGTEVECEVTVGGNLSSNKGMNLPGTSLSAPALTEKDKEDLLFGLMQDVDYVALSFVRRPEDIQEARQFMEEHKPPGVTPPPIIAKIERPEAIENLPAILKEADGVMVARGDLGVETSSADVPILQKRIISLSGQLGKIDITATQMLLSMVESPRPTRAEASDVANAVFDGTDAVMLSNETATGKYPVEAVRNMAEIALKAEGVLDLYGRFSPPLRECAAEIAEATVRAACLAAEDLHARAIVVFTRSGRTAILISALRTLVPIVAFTPDPRTFRRLALVWGVEPYLSEEVRNADDLVRHQEQRLRNLGIADTGDTVVMVAGTTDMLGITNMMKIHRMGG